MILLQRKVHKTIFFSFIFLGNLDDETLRQVHLDLCYACSKAIPIEVEDGLQRLASLLLNSTQTLKHIRGVCSRLKQKIRHCQGRLSEKALLISQLEEAIKHLGMSFIFIKSVLYLIKNLHFFLLQETKLTLLLRRMRKNPKILLMCKENSMTIINLLPNSNLIT